MNNAEKIIQSRKKLVEHLPFHGNYKVEEEGGCGVTGFICSIPVSGKNIFEPSYQMRNRGNGKGGGISAMGFIPEQLGISQQMLDEDFMLHIALIENDVQEDLENRFINPYFIVDKSDTLDRIDDYRSIGLEVKPPGVVRYFIRVKEDALAQFVADNNLQSLSKEDAEEELISQNCYKINTEYYASLGDKQAFVLSSGKNIMILKVVGFAEKVIEYYKLEDLKAHAWIAHQRYPTRGRVWHPGGCHPFSSMNAALVHNGDFANYFSVSQYLEQKNYHPLFLTDTEEAVLLLDLWGRVYKYPLEYLIEAMAPTSELDFDMLPEEKQKIYKAIQTHHVSSSPDGPWFFIISRNDVANREFQLIGITDTSMLRPQVFALQEGEVQIGLICSEKQAIDATLKSLAQEDSRFRPIADKYWNARGGSYTDGGAFVFTMKNKNGSSKLTCTDKFGTVIETVKDRVVCDLSAEIATPDDAVKNGIESALEENNARKIFDYVKNSIKEFNGNALRYCINAVKKYALQNDAGKAIAIEALTLLNDRRYDTGTIKRSSALQIFRETIDDILLNTRMITDNADSTYCLIDFESRDAIHTPKGNETTLIINAKKFTPQDDTCDAVLIKKAFDLGWKQFIVFKYRGQRFAGNGLGPATEGVRIDVYGSSGDYLASGIDGMEIHVHDNAQDQLCQIMKSGKLVVHGDVGQTFMYGAKGGSVFVMGNAAGRPLINAVGKPKVVINGTALDYLAESFMAGDPLKGGGFVILNGICFDERTGAIKEYDTPYSGSNIFSLASGGAIYVRDPHRKLVEEQLNGGVYRDLSDADWELIHPFLKENEEHFGIAVEDLLTVNGEKREPKEVYRKIAAQKLAVLTKDVEEDGLEE